MDEFDNTKLDDMKKNPVKMNPEQIEIFAMTMATLVTPHPDENEIVDMKVTTKEYGLIALGLMLLESFGPTQMILGDQIKTAQIRFADGTWTPNEN